MGTRWCQMSFPFLLQTLIRDPTIFIHARKQRDYMLQTHQVAPRVVLFDMGATQYSDSRRNGLRWLVDSFERLGLRIDELFAWEAVNMPAAEFFKGMPAWLPGRTHWYNSELKLGWAFIDQRTLCAPDLYKSGVDTLVTIILVSNLLCSACRD